MESLFPRCEIVGPVSASAADQPKLTRENGHFWMIRDPAIPVLTKMFPLTPMAFSA